MDPACGSLACGWCYEPEPFCTSSGHCGACPDDMVAVAAVDVCIDRYEISMGAGSRAASVRGATPWANVSWDEARAACELAGKRLCDEDEWFGACVPPGGGVYPYGEVYSAHRCNGNDHGAGGATPTGSMSECEGGYPGIFDMSGNMWEWTSTCADGRCRVRGGSFGDPGSDQLRCAAG